MGVAPVEEKRYVDDGADLGYKTRAFVLDVIVRDDQLPNLLASLTNSDFPVEIVRVDVSSRLVPGGTGGGLPGGGGMMTGMGSSGGGMAGMNSEAAYGMPGDPGGGMGYGETEYGAAGLGGGEETILGSGSPYGSSGPGYPGMMPGGGGGMQTASAKGKKALDVAMGDPMLVHVKIGGLMTLYQSAQEADAEAATAEIDQTVAPAPAAPGELVPDETADPNMTEGSEATDPDTETVAPTATELPDGEAEGNSGNATSEATDPEANPSAVPDNSSEEPGASKAPGTEPSESEPSESAPTGAGDS